MKKIDMHVHTTASDGIFSPMEIVESAKKNGLKGIAITDHDTIEGISEAIEASKKYKDFIVIPGIEFSTIFDEVEVHILGYFIDFNNPKILYITEKMKNHRLERGKRIIEKLQEMDVDITLEDIYKVVEEGVIGRVHIGRVLVNKGYVSSINEAFEKFLKKGRPAYVERFKLTIKEAVDMIEISNGIPVLAHPGLIDKKIKLTTIIEKGIRGIEVYHPKHSMIEKEYYLNLAKKYNLFITGGSDYHDGIVNGLPTVGSTAIPYETIMKMKRS